MSEEEAPTSFYDALQKINEWESPYVENYKKKYEGIEADKNNWPFNIDIDKFKADFEELCIEQSNCTATTEAEKVMLKNLELKADKIFTPEIFSMLKLKWEKLNNSGEQQSDESDSQQKKLEKITNEFFANYYKDIYPSIQYFSSNSKNDRFKYFEEVQKAILSFETVLLKSKQLLPNSNFKFDQVTDFKQEMVNAFIENSYSEDFES